MKELILTTEPDIDPTRIVKLAAGDSLDVRVDEEVARRMDASRRLFERLSATGTPIYGWNTGFGPHVRYPGRPGDPEHARGLLEHLAAGYGADMPVPVVRTTILLRLITLSRGYSAVRADRFAAYAGLLRISGAPAVPLGGSLGASGDLIPLAHIARILTGQGVWLTPGESAPAPNRIDAAELIQNKQLAPCEPDAREALAFTNGTSSSTAWALHALVQGERLIDLSEEITAGIHALLGCSREALDATLHRARGHADQSASALNIERHLRNYFSDAAMRSEERPLQEPYSLRAVPQVLGAVRAQLEHARRLIATEIAGVDDNPIFPPEEPARALHGANFFGQQIAFAADAVNAALCQAGLLAERQLDLLLDPTRNGGAPLLLAGVPGRHSGLAGLQLTATALAAEMRSQAAGRASGSIPTNGGNQDIVPMAHEAGRAAREQTRRLAGVLGSLIIALNQLNDLRANGNAPGEARKLPEKWPVITRQSEDRALRDDLARIITELLTEY